MCFFRPESDFSDSGLKKKIKTGFKIANKKCHKKDEFYPNFNGFMSYNTKTFEIIPI